MKKIDLCKILRKKVLVLDGAVGTELQKRGMPVGKNPELWCLKNPEIIQSLHREYSQAGADIIYSCTFGANRIKLAQYGSFNIRKINKQLSQLARKAVQGNSFVAGDIGPTGKFVEPFGQLAFEQAVNIFKEQVKGLLEGGVDLFVIETMMDIQEARAALIAVRELSDKFTIVTMTYSGEAVTLNGTDPVTALITLQSLGADAVGCNCSTGPQQMIDLVKIMKPYAKVPLVAKPNAGVPRLKRGRAVFDMSALEFAAYGRKFVQSGVNLLGGCCGTSPLYINYLKKKIGFAKPLSPRTKPISALSSARSHIILKKNAGLVTVGECINPTNKKALQDELRQGKMTLIRYLAAEQEKKGARLLDVNVGVSGIDEINTLRKVITLLAVATKLPLVIDSSKIEAIESALRIYPGRTLINSISAEKAKMKKLLALAAKYGAMFILLPLSEKELPRKFEKRKEIIKYVFNQAKHYGLGKEDIVVDGLVMSVSADPNAAVETMKTVRWAAENFKTNTICGLSNISFGLPKRSLINTTFRLLLRNQGLSMVIDNPLSEPVKYSKKAEDVLLAKDKNACNYIAYCQKSTQGKVRYKKLTEEQSPAKSVFMAIIDGNREDIKSYLKNALKTGISPLKLVNCAMIPAINKVGDLFDRKEYFLPQLIASAETMKIAFSYIEPKLKKTKKISTEKTVVVLATVKGDIHDIGKNIVALMLKNHGFVVKDLGKDVSAKKIIKEAKKYKTPIIGLSALMTTTMVNMEKVIKLSRKEKFKCRFLVGGAVVTNAYARSIGANYADNGVAAVRVAKKLTKK